MDRKIAIKYATGEARALLAEAWFTLLGFVAATTILHAASEKADALILSALKWFSYVLIFGWVNYKIDQAIFAHFPSADPTNKRSKTSHMMLSISTSFMVMLAIYHLVFFLAKLLLDPP